MSGTNTKHVSSSETSKMFWNWELNRQEGSRRVLRITGSIVSDTLYEENTEWETSSLSFRRELAAEDGPLDVFISSGGGECTAAAEIYTMLKTYPNHVRVIIESVAASAASVIAMAGDEVLMSEPALMMIHDPMSLAFGDSGEMVRAQNMLAAVKDSIVNAYKEKTALPRERIEQMMSEETWMDAQAAISFGFADGVYRPKKRDGIAPVAKKEQGGRVYSARATFSTLLNKIEQLRTDLKLADIGNETEQDEEEQMAAGEKPAVSLALDEAEGEVPVSDRPAVSPTSDEGREPVADLDRSVLYLLGKLEASEK